MPLPTQEEAEAFDLDSADALDEAELAVRHPTSDAPTTWVWTFYGPGHAKTIELANRVSRKSLRELQEQKQARLNGKKVKIEDQTLDQLREETVGHIVARTKTFTPVKLGGETIHFSEDAARQLLLDRRKGWLYKQITEYLAADENFIGPSAKS